MQPRLPDGKGAPGNAWANYRPIATLGPAPGLPPPRPAGKSRGPGLPVTEAVIATRRWAAEAEAVLHLVDKDDVEAAGLLRSLAVIADVAGGVPTWAHLRPHYNPTLEWPGLLDNLGLDAENQRSLERLCAAGAAGQAEGNRLIATWMKPAGFNWLAYRVPHMVYQKGINEARESLSQDYSPWSYSAWFPSGARGQPGLAWAAMGHYEPSWARPNAMSLWNDVIKDAQDKPLGWKTYVPQFPYWRQANAPVRGGARARGR